jgi:hypothetical protein
MKHYNLNFGKAENRDALLRNTLNLLLGASLAMEATGAKRLQTTFAGEYTVLFQTDSENFVSFLRTHISVYEVTLTEFVGPGRPLAPIASQLRW